MSDKIITINNNLDQNQKKNKIWQPVRNGKKFLEYLDSNKKLEEFDKKNLFNDSINLLSQTINPNIIENIRDNSTGLCFGQIQSGKTTSMEAISALAHDNQFRIIILLTGNVTPLAAQNTSRVDRALQGRDWLVIKNLPRVPWNMSENKNKLKVALNPWISENKIIKDTFNKTVLILSMKNPSKINRIAKLFSEASSWNNSIYDKIPTIIIDDEADHHSLNSKSSKNTADDKDENDLYKVQEGETWESIAEDVDKNVKELKEINPELSGNSELMQGDLINTEYQDIRTHDAIRNLRSIFNFHSFLGYTATPNANLLTNTFNFLSPNFSQILEPGSNYTGLEFFFSQQKLIDKYVSPIEANIQELEDSNERPKSLEDALMHFIVSVACGYISGHYKENNRSMFIHPDRDLDSHDQYISWINALKMKWDGELKADKKSDEYKDLIQYIKNILESIRDNSDNKEEVPNFSDDFIEYFRESLAKIIPTKFNAGKGGRIPEIEWDRDYAHLLIGGQGLDRGFTVEGITVSYLSRPAGTRQQDTILQRARFFGYHKKNKNYIKIFLTDELSDFFRDTYHSDRELRMSLKRHSENPENNLKDWPRVWISQNIGNYKLTKPGVNNMWNIVSRNLPPPPARQGYAWLMKPSDLDSNKKVYKNIRDKYANKLKKISSIEEINKNNPWAKNDEALIVKDVSLKSVYEDIISEIKHEPRDVRPFAIHEQIMSYYLNSGKEELICPIIFMDGRNYRSPPKNKKYHERIQSAGGPDDKLKNNPGDKTLFPGDRVIHYEYLIGQSNSYSANYFPTLQIYNFKITSEANGNGKVLGTDIPFFNFYMPRQCWSDIIMGIKKNVSSR